jgi:hypothetical protein
MLRHGLGDLRLFWENDVRMLEHSEMKVPVSWLREYVEFDLPVEELARRLVFTSCEVDRVVRRGVAEGTATSSSSSSARYSRRRSTQDADRLQLTKVDVGGGARRARSCAARGTSAPARPSPCVAGRGATERPDTRAPQGTRRVSDGMILAEDEVDLGTDHSGIMVLDAEYEPGTPLADVLPLGDTVLEIETGYNRPGPHVDLRHRPRGLCPARRAPCAHARSPGLGDLSERRAGGHPDRGLRAVPALHRATLPRRAGRRLARTGSRHGCSAPACARSRTSST